MASIPPIPRPVHPVITGTRDLLAMIAEQIRPLGVYTVATQSMAWVFAGEQAFRLEATDIEERERATRLHRRCVHGDAVPLGGTPDVAAVPFPLPLPVLAGGAPEADDGDDDGPDSGGWDPGQLEAVREWYRRHPERPEAW